MHRGATSDGSSQSTGRNRTTACIAVIGSFTGCRHQQLCPRLRTRHGCKNQVTFGTAVRENEVTQALEELGYTDVEVQAQDTNSVEITIALLDTAGRQELRAGLVDMFGPIVNFQVTETQTPNADQMEWVVDIICRRLTLLGIEDALVQRSNANRLLVHIPKLRLPETLKTSMH